MATRLPDYLRYNAFFANRRVETFGVNFMPIVISGKCLKYLAFRFAKRRCQIVKPIHV